MDIIIPLEAPGRAQTLHSDLQVLAQKAIWLATRPARLPQVD
jgi:hypothetical protein